MASSRLPLFLCSIVLQLVAHTIAQQDTPLDELCLSEMGNFAKKSKYKANLDRVLSTISSNTKINYGFYTASYGRNNDKLMQWHFAEEMLIPTVAVVALKLLLWSSGNIVPTRKRLLSGTIIVC